MKKWYLALGISILALIIVPTVYAATQLHYISFELSSGASDSTEITTKNKNQSFSVQWDKVTVDSGITSDYYLTVQVTKLGWLGIGNTMICNLDMYNPTSGASGTKDLGTPGVGNFKYYLKTYKSSQKGTVYVTEN